MGFEQLAKLPFEGIGIVGLVILLGFMVYRGLLVPRSVVTDLTTSRDARIADLAAERDKLLEAQGKLVDAFNARNEQHAELMELARTTDAFIRSLPRAGGNRR